MPWKPLAVIAAEAGQGRVGGTLMGEARVARRDADRAERDRPRQDAVAEPHPVELQEDLGGRDRRDGRADGGQQSPGRS